MSYSFTVIADEREDVGEKVSAALDHVCETQPEHSADRDVAQETAESLSKILEEPGDARRVSVSVSGSVGWDPGKDKTSFLSANLSVYASLVAADPPKSAAAAESPAPAESAESDEPGDDPDEVA